MEIYKGECVSRWLFPITKMTPKLFSTLNNKTTHQFYLPMTCLYMVRSAGLIIG